MPSPRTRCCSRCRPTRSIRRCRRRSAGCWPRSGCPRARSPRSASSWPSSPMRPVLRHRPHRHLRRPSRRQLLRRRHPPPDRPAPAPAAGSAPRRAEPAPSDAASDLPLSPVVRRLINQAGIDPTTITGTGVGGRITRSDVEAAIAASGRLEPAAVRSRAGGTDACGPAPPPAAAAPAPAPARTAAGSRPLAPASAPAADGDADERRVPMNNIRRLTAQYMVQSKQISPHVLTAVEVDFEGVEKVRQAHRAEWKSRRGFQPDLPALHRPGAGRRTAGVPAHQRQRRRRRVDPPRRGQPGDRRRSRLPGSARAGRQGRRDQASAGAQPRDQRPRRPSPIEEALRRRDHRWAPSPSPTPASTAR